MRTPTLVLGLAAASLVALPGCYRPHGAMIPWTGAAATYYSYEMAPKTVRVLDLRTSETIFSMDIPPGKQLVMQFVAGEGDDPVYTPDVLRYEVMEMGTETGKLRSQMTVPAASSRKVEVEIRQGPEYAAASPERLLRTDELADRPGWWSPEGGPMPDDWNGTTKYDR